MTITDQVPPDDFGSAPFRKPRREPGLPQVGRWLGPEAVYDVAGVGMRRSERTGQLGELVHDDVGSPMRAGVSVQTIYNVVGGKSVLLKVVYDVTLAGDDEPVPMAQRPIVQATTAASCASCRFEPTRFGIVQLPGEPAWGAAGEPADGKADNTVDGASAGETGGSAGGGLALAHAANPAPNRTERPSLLATLPIAQILSLPALKRWDQYRSGVAEFDRRAVPSPPQENRSGVELGDTRAVHSGGDSEATADAQRQEGRMLRGVFRSCGTPPRRAWVGACRIRR